MKVDKGKDNKEKINSRKDNREKGDEGGRGGRMEEKNIFDNNNIHI
jgi:hypothetical protein